MLIFPNFDPVAIHIGPIPYIGTLAVRWYSLAYIGGILLGWWLIAREHARKPLPGLTPKALDDMVTWAVIGIVFGGRLGYVLFYKPNYFMENPSQILHIWEGGMSFHGGLAGTILAFWLFCRKYRIRFLSLMDLLACAAPIGLFLGRVANFINGELYGRPTDMPWGMVFPRAETVGGVNLPRHPSQLYEAGMEGILLFTLLLILLKKTNARDKPGLLAGIFISGYALARITAECFREPDNFLGFFAGFTTMGQILSLPMLACGLYLIFRRTKAAAA